MNANDNTSRDLGQTAIRVYADLSVRHTKAEICTIIRTLTIISGMWEELAHVAEPQPGPGRSGAKPESSR